MYNNQNLIGKKVLIPDYRGNSKILNLIEFDSKKYNSYYNYIYENNFELVEAEIMGQTTLKNDPFMGNSNFLHQFILKIKSTNVCICLLPVQIIRFLD